MKTFRQEPLAFFLSFFILTSAFCQTLHAQPAAADDTRIARLAGLARVWGTVKYFHPFLAYRDVDWDKALRSSMRQSSSCKVRRAGLCDDIPESKTLTNMGGS